MVCHRFPNPRKDMVRLQSWINILGLENLDPMSVYSKKFICALHFSNDCSSPGTKKLNANAYPSINLPNTQRVNVGILQENIKRPGTYTNYCIQLLHFI